MTHNYVYSRGNKLGDLLSANIIGNRTNVPATSNQTAEIFHKSQKTIGSYWATWLTYYCSKVYNCVRVKFEIEYWQDFHIKINWNRKKLTKIYEFPQPQTSNNHQNYFSAFPWISVKTIIIIYSGAICTIAPRGTQIICSLNYKASVAQWR